MLRIAAAGLLGVRVGVGLFTFHYAEGWSYFSKDPEACASCHIMAPQYASWLESSHESVAGCADCHLPAEFPHSLIAKAANGWSHSWGFTFQDFHEPIQLKEQMGACDALRGRDVEGEGRPCSLARIGRDGQANATDAARLCRPWPDFCPRFDGRCHPWLTGPSGGCRMG